MSTQSRRTSFYALTGDQPPDTDLVIERIEVPHYQRDYAQGRESDSVKRIRTDFLDVLVTAIRGDDQAAIGLDFVYGGVHEGTLRPLDGQQRLTTLFLLHWYIASRSGHLAEDHGWKRFSYATRQSAGMFCERLVEAPLPDPLPDDVKEPSDWITDQHWYLFVWRHDPTIQSMLVMIDAIHERFQEVDASIAWARLTDVDDPAVWFLLLPLSGLSSASGQEMRPEELYIKMNSRGKPLTEFENFKARFEKTIQSSPRSGEFALKVDTAWSDLLWHLKGEDYLIDDEFMRYMEFVTEVCEWRDGRGDGAGQRLGLRTLAVFGDENPQHEAHLDFLFQAFDVWVERPITETFASLFTSTGNDQGDEPRVRLFFRNDGGQPDAVNLFEACCRSYETVRGARTFSLGQSLILYAVVLHLIEDTAEFRRRVRVLRNLVEASSDELRLDRMPRIVEDVHRVIRHGAIDEVATLNQAQVEDEVRKAIFLEENSGPRSAVFALENHEFLRGSLSAFEYDAATFERRASVFQRLMTQPDLWPDLLSALLAVGEYQRQRNPRSFLFGTDSSRHGRAWRELLTGTSRDRLQPTREVLAEFLDLVASASAPLGDTLETISQGYLARCETEERFDWRYYMVKYSAMREEGASIFYAEPMEGVEQPSMSYSLCMLRGGYSSLKGYYRDPYLLAIWRQLDYSGVVEDKWFNGYETEPRRLPLTRSGATIRCVAPGFELSPPPLDAHAKEFAAACAELGANAANVVVVPQVKVDHRLVDTVDRIQVGADIVRRLVAAGL